MAKVIIGEAAFEFDGKQLTVSSQDQSDVLVRFDAGDIRRLMDLLSGLEENEVNRRQAFRVLLDDSGGLVVDVRIGTEQIPVKPRNISITGLFAEICQEHRHLFTIGTPVEVILDYAGRTQSYAGIVRRREADGCGIFFPDSLKGEHLDPPGELSRLVMELQRRRVRQRTELAQ